MGVGAGSMVIFFGTFHAGEGGSADGAATGNSGARRLTVRAGMGDSTAGAAVDAVGGGATAAGAGARTVVGSTFGEADFSGERKNAHDAPNSTANKNAATMAAVRRVRPQARNSGADN